MFWSYISKFPVDIIASNIILMLDLKDLINIESAYVRGMPNWWQAAIQLSEPLDLDDFADSKSIHVFTEIFSRGMKVRLVRWVSERGEQEMMELLNCYVNAIKEVTLWISELRPSNELISKCSHLKLVEHIEPEFFLAVGTHAVNLSSLDMFSGDTDAEKVTAIRAMAPNLLKLKRLSLFISVLSEEVVAVIKPAAASLETLYLDMDTLVPENVCAIAAQCPSLTSITINERTAYTMNYHLNLNQQQQLPGERAVDESDVWLSAVAQCCPRLQYLCANKCRFTLQGIRALVQGCRQLRTLTVPMNVTMAAAVMEVCAVADTPLQQLHIKGALLGDVRAYQRLFSRLETVELDAVFLDTFGSSDAVSQMCALRDLTLRGIKNYDDGSGITFAVGAAAGHCPLLSRLHISGVCSRDGVAFAAALCEVLVRGRNLTELSLQTNCVGPLPDNLVGAVGECTEGLKNLTILTYRVTDKQLMYMAPALRKLTVFNAANSTELTDVAVLALAQHCRQLTSVNLMHSPGITEAALVQLAQRCRKLRLLTISRLCPSTEETYNALLKENNRLHSLEIHRM